MAGTACSEDEIAPAVAGSECSEGEIAPAVAGSECSERARRIFTASRNRENTQHIYVIIT